jgi:hypothetical protein
VDLLYIFLIMFFASMSLDSYCVMCMIGHTQDFKISFAKRQNRRLRGNVPAFRFQFRECDGHFRERFERNNTDYNNPLWYYRASFDPWVFLLFLAKVIKRFVSRSGSQLSWQFKRVLQMPWFHQNLRSVAPDS